MSYTGPERRLKQNVDCPVGGCPMSNETHTTIEVLKNDMEHIKGAVDKIAKSMEEANKARAGWWMALAGMFLTVLIQTSCFVFFLGGALKQIEVNTERISLIESKITRLNTFQTSTILEN